MSEADVLNSQETQVNIDEPHVNIDESHELMSKGKRFLMLLKSKKFWTDIVGKIFIYILLTDFALVFFIPVLYMFSTSIKTPLDLLDSSVVWLPKRGIYWENLRLGFEAIAFWQTAWFTIKVVAVCTVGHIISGTLVGYALGRLKFFGKGFIFGLVIFTLILPTQTLLTSLTLLYSDLGISNEWTLIIPTFFGLGLNGGIFIFIYRQVFAAMPKELEEAAMIDDCGIFSTFWRIMRPLTSSATLVTAILSVVWHWNDYYEPATFFTNITSTNTLMSIRVRHLFINPQMFNITWPDGTSYTGTQPEMWTTLLSLIPLMIFYLLVQRRFMRSVANTGIKG